ncbi:MAG: two-component system sensor histidine kinase NtrB [Tissierella sp.]|uniref:two-component system sensor histidine kinase NtrB n=1 Tax=Tissierella sp. TaxID=41274 RepID=UPI003F9E582B
MLNKKTIKDKYFWLISFLTLLITFLHYSNLMSEWELHIFYRKLYYLPIILSSFRYRLKGGLISSIIISILYAPHISIFGSGLSITLLNQYLEMVLFLTIGYITGKLVETDYEKQKKLENKIIEITKLQNYTKNIVDSINSGVLSLDTNFNITSINKEGEKIFGVKEVLGSNILKIFDEKYIDDIFNQAKIQRTQFANINSKINIEGIEKYLVLTVTPLFNILNKLQGLVVIIQDKSKEKNLEAQAIRSDRLVAVGELATGIAHEIRNPMGIIKTISQTLQEENDNEDLLEGLEIIIKEIDRANRVIDGILNFAKPIGNEMKEVSLNALLEEVVNITNKYVKKQNVIIELYLEDEINIIADKEKLMQVFINLIFNASQAMAMDGKIIITTVTRDSGVNISFKDTGIGIKKEDIKKLFNPFFTTKEKGIGLGLSVSDRIIQDHNGYMIIDSIEGEGTQVDIYLPLGKKEGVTN